MSRSADPAADGVVAHNRAVWSAVNDQYTDGEAEQRWAEPEVVWGLFRRPERELGVLGDLVGIDVVELGCGTAYLSAALARGGARPVAVDVSRAQLASARRLQQVHRVPFPLVEADGARVPLRSSTFDLVVSEYGASPWCTPDRWLAEAARLLRPGGRLVALTNSVLAALCVPAEGGVAGDRLLRAQAAVNPVTWPGGGTEYHLGHGDWIRELRAAGFVVDALLELTAPDDAVDHEWYEIVTADWARAWPAEDLWVAHLREERPDTHH